MEKGGRDRKRRRKGRELKKKQGAGPLGKVYNTVMDIARELLELGPFFRLRTAGISVYCLVRHATESVQPNR